MLETLGVSMATVALAEVGDKTQLLAIVLVAHHRRPTSILLGILIATLLNHAIAAWLGATMSEWLVGTPFRLAVGLSFIAMAAWTLVPDKADSRAPATRGGSAFLAALVAFFLVEIGDKTQIATSLLAARYHDAVLVTAGTTLGMMMANVPAVYLGEALTRVVPLSLVRFAAAGLFFAIGAWITMAALI